MVSPYLVWSPFKDTRLPSIYTISVIPPEVTRDGVQCVEFVCGGKYKVNVLVDQKAWDEYLNKYHWTALKRSGNYYTIKTSVNKQSMAIYRIIIENNHSELDYWGRTIDHKNNDPLDNRLSNLEISSSKLNCTNVSSKFELDDMQLIHKQPGGGYKVHTNIDNRTIYKNFQTLEEARVYRDEIVIPLIKETIDKMEKKTRNIEFERGLRDKLKNSEKDEVIEILNRYGIFVTIQQME